jgi:glucokinase
LTNILTVMAASLRERLILSVDLGGTKTATALIRGDARILDRNQENTLQDGPERGIAQIVRLLQAQLHANGLQTEAVQGIGVGIPAVLEADTDRVLWAPNLAGWREVDLRSALESKLNLPVFIEYDGHAAVLGEWWAGAGKGCRSLVSVIIGTGIGGGMVLEGKLIRGQDRLAGAAGWFALTTRSELIDRRGKAVGYWESLAAGPGVALHARAQLEQHPESSLWELEKTRPITTKDIFEAAAQGDLFARQSVNGLAEILGIGVANIVSLINPQIVILGGSIGSNCQIILPRIRSIEKKCAQPVSGASVRVVCSRLGTDAGLLGAAYGAILRLEGIEKTTLARA